MSDERKKESPEREREKEEKNQIKTLIETIGIRIDIYDSDDTVIITFQIVNIFFPASRKRLLD